MRCHMYEKILDEEDKRAEHQGHVNFEQIKTMSARERLARTKPCGGTLHATVLSTNGIYEYPSVVFRCTANGDVVIPNIQHIAAAAIWLSDALHDASEPVGPCVRRIKRASTDSCYPKYNIVMMESLARVEFYRECGAHSSKFCDAFDHKEMSRRLNARMALNAGTLTQQTKTATKQERIQMKCHMFEAEIRTTGARPDKKIHLSESEMRPLDVNGKILAFRPCTGNLIASIEAENEPTFSEGVATYAKIEVTWQCSKHGRIASGPFEETTLEGWVNARLSEDRSRFEESKTTKNNMVL